MDARVGGYDPRLAMRKILWFIVYLLIFSLGFGVAALGFRSWKDHLAIVTGETVTGQVAGSKVERDGIAKGTASKYRFEVEYRFDHAGRTHTSTNHYSDGWKRKIDASELEEEKRRFGKHAPVEVRFDPDDPTRCALTIWPSPIMWLGLALVLLLCGAPVYAAIRRTRGIPVENAEKPRIDVEAALAKVRLPREKLEPFVARCEQEYSTDPERFRRRLVWLARTIPTTLFGCSLALLGAAIWLARDAPPETNKSRYKTAFVCGFLGSWTLRMLVLRDKPIEGGVRLTPKQAPRLFAQIEELVERTGADPIDEVIVDGSLNAAVVSRATSGLLGRWRNSLIVGLRLMASMPPEEFRSVLAHEIGHLSARDGVAARSIYRLRAYWLRVMAATAAKPRSRKDPALRLLFHFVARFEARSLVLGRRQELRADALSVEAVGPATAAAALVRIHHVTELEESLYTETLKARIRTMPEPPQDPLELVRAIARTPVDPYEAHRRLRAALAREADPYDTHPTLERRVAAMNMTPRIAVPYSQDAAATLLDGESTRIAREVFSEWAESLTPVWRAEHEAWTRGNARRDELGSIASRTIQEEFELAQLVEPREGGPAALPHYEAVLSRAPDHLSAAFHVARLRLESGDLSASDAILAIAAVDPDVASPACTAIARCLSKLDRPDDASQWERRAVEENEEDRRASAERESTSLADELIPHDLDSASTSRLYAALRSIPALHGAYLARRVVRHRPHRPHYVIGLESAKLATRWFGIGKRAEAIRLAEAAFRALESLNLSARVFGLDLQPARDCKRLKRIAGSRLGPPA